MNNVERVITNLELQISSAEERKEQLKNYSSDFSKKEIEDRCKDIDDYINQAITALQILKKNK